MCKTRFVGSTIIGIWTIIQSVFHLLFSFYGFSFYSCHFLPSHYYLVFIYLTYFYNHKCGTIELDSHDYFFELSRDEGNSSQKAPPLFNFVKDVLNHGQFPQESLLASTTNIYLLIFMIIDICWIVTSIVLLIGNFMNITKIRSIPFYLPWILVAIVVNVFDVVAAVDFGFDIRTNNSIKHWLKFVGITNPELFEKYDDPQLGLATHAFVPSVIISALSCRFLIFWIFNVICLFQVCNYFLNALRFDKVPSRSKTRRHYSSAVPVTSRSTLTSQLNTSEARIRQWQLFYGSSEINSTTESAENEVAVDVNSNCRSLSRSLSSPMELNKPTTSTFAVQRHMSFNGNTYHQYSDVAEYIGGVVEVRNTPMKTLRGQLPWSYVHGLDERKLEQAKLAKSRHESVTVL